MTSDTSPNDAFNQRDRHNVPLKHQGVIKAFNNQSNRQYNKTIKLKPLKEFSSQVQATPVQEAPEIQEEQIAESVQDIPEIESNPINHDEELDSFSVMKRNVNEEMRHYRDSQLQSIQEELVQLKVTAKQEGYEEGYNEGKENFLLYSESFFEYFNALKASRHEDLKLKREFIISLSLSIAEHIISKQIQKDSSLFETLFMEAIEKITEKDVVAFTINPEDKKLFDTLQKTFKEKFKEIQRLEIRMDEAIMRGGCTIDTNLGFIDATVNSKLEIIKQAIDTFHEQEDANESLRELAKQKALEAAKERAVNNSEEQNDFAISESDSYHDGDESIADNFEQDALINEEGSENQETFDDYTDDDDYDDYDDYDDDEDDDDDDDDDDSNDSDSTFNTQESNDSDDMDNLFDGIDFSDFDDDFDDYK